MLGTGKDARLYHAYYIVQALHARWEHAVLISSDPGIIITSRTSRCGALCVTGLAIQKEVRTRHTETDDHGCKYLVDCARRTIRENVERVVSAQAFQKSNFYFSAALDAKE